MDTPIVPIFIRRIGVGRHHVEVEAPLFPGMANDGGTALVELTDRCTQAVERAIRRSPAQWLWAHDRWRTRPPGGGCT